MHAARETPITNELITTKKNVNAVRQPGCMLVTHTKCDFKDRLICVNDYLYIDIMQNISDPARP